MKSRIYFDYNATSPMRDEVKKSYINALDIYGNPSSIHETGRKARREIEGSRKKIADYASVSTNNVIFTSSATEANNMILLGNNMDVLLIPEDEHDCILATAENSTKEVLYLKITSDGDIDREYFHDVLQECVNNNKKPFLTVMKVNNETGRIKNFSDLSIKIREAGGILHSDAVQALGKISFDDWTWQTDSMTISPHKVGGPKGIGCLIIKDKIPIKPLIKGGGQEENRRAGTQNIPAIIAWGTLMDQMDNSLKEIKEIEIWKKEIISFLNAKCPNAKILCPKNSVSNTLSIILPNVEAEKAVILADLSGFEISSGSACSSGKIKPSHVLTSYGYKDKQAKSAIRISMGFGNTQYDIDKLNKFLLDIAV